MGKLYRVKRKLQKKWEAYKIKITKPNKDALWVFGVQKSGTSAIAGLLAHRANKTVTLDTPYLWEPYYSEIISGNLSLKHHVIKNPFPFSKDIIKEPAASVMIGHIEKIFNLPQYLFIYREPHDVIRSILNRLDLPGNKKNVNFHSIDANWQIHFKSHGKNYINDLIELWINVYSQKEYINNPNCILVTYKDFVQDKQKFIDGLCKKLNYKPVKDIAHLLDHNFQPKGNSNVNLKSFFGEENYNNIENKTKAYQL